MNDKNFEKLVFGMAHQIRNPCAIILANANLLLQNPQLNPEMTRSLESIVKGVKYLEDRLDEFVEFSKPLNLNLKEVPVFKIFQEARSILKQQVELKKIEISCNVDEGLVLPKADHNQILLALLNILLNSIESSGQNGAITLTGRRAEGQVLIEIKDAGCGIHPRDLPEVFSPFYSTKKDGIGIGLAVAKRIVEAHQGRIEIASQQKAGTTVTIQFPI